MDYQHGCVASLQEPELRFVRSVSIHILQMEKLFSVFIGLRLLHSVFLLKNIFILQSFTVVERRK
jgi:hypothetical protein